MGADRPVPGYVCITPYRIGKYSYVMEMCHISQNVEIGNFTSIANLCTLGAQQHPYHLATTFPFAEILAHKTDKKTIIGSDVWIGSNVVVMEGVRVGHGAVVGAGAVVTKDIPPYAIAVGNPARVMRYRFEPALIADLLRTAWWERSEEVIRTLDFTDPKALVAQLSKI